MNISKIQYRILIQLNKYIAYSGDIKMYKRFRDDNNDNDLYREIKKYYPNMSEKMMGENLMFLENLSYIEQGRNLHPNYKELGVRITQSGRNYIEMKKNNFKNKISSLVVSILTTIITTIIIDLIIKRLN